MLLKIISPITLARDFIQWRKDIKAEGKKAREDLAILSLNELKRLFGYFDQFFLAVPPVLSDQIEKIKTNPNFKFLEVDLSKENAYPEHIDPYTVLCVHGKDSSGRKIAVLSYFRSQNNEIGFKRFYEDTGELAYSREQNLKGVFCEKFYEDGLLHTMRFTFPWMFSPHMVIEKTCGSTWHIKRGRNTTTSEKLNVYSSADLINESFHGLSYFEKSIIE